MVQASGQKLVPAIFVCSIAASLLEACHLQKCLHEILRIPGKATSNVQIDPLIISISALNIKKIHRWNVLMTLPKTQHSTQRQWCSETCTANLARLWPRLFQVQIIQRKFRLSWRNMEQISVQIHSCRSVKSLGLWQCSDFPGLGKGILPRPSKRFWKFFCIPQEWTESYTFNGRAVHSKFYQPAILWLNLGSKLSVVSDSEYRIRFADVPMILQCL